MDDPIDLSPLDPRRDPARFERMVGAIVQAAMTPPRATRGTLVLAELLRWTRPALAAAAVVALVAGTALFSLRRPSAAPGEAILEAVGIPEPLAAWARADHYPSTAELLAAFPQAGDRPAPSAPQPRIP
ncbi:MAG TPA: hypothetical protein VLD58_15830 [Gemmatimonadales bacterium]|nr:hypothetical protein [Gemmatimonadales bacterium]